MWLFGGCYGFSPCVQDKLVKEEKSAAHNRKKLQVQWRQIMRKGEQAGKDNGSLVTEKK